MTDTDSWEQAMRQTRQEKDDFFARHPNSPIPQDQREAFDGLDYFPPDPDLRYELELHEHDEKETVEIDTTTEGVRNYLRWGEFRFEVNGEECTLQAYKADADERRLWVPFRDETNKTDETYGAGRYIDLEMGEHTTTDGNWVLDFNQAYNPYCAYSAMYECPLIPMENWLDVRIEAGEKNYDSPHGYHG
ncbi:DUF1684 domain-containing protein [Halobacteriaceae archaeon GCM10025711]